MHKSDSCWVSLPRHQNSSGLEPNPSTRARIRHKSMKTVSKWFVDSLKSGTDSRRLLCLHTHTDPWTDTALAAVTASPPRLIHPLLIEKRGRKGIMMSQGAGRDGRESSFLSPLFFLLPSQAQVRRVRTQDDCWMIKRSLVAWQPVAMAPRFWCTWNSNDGENAKTGRSPYALSSSPSPTPPHPHPHPASCPP